MWRCFSVVGPPLPVKLANGIIPNGSTRRFSNNHSNDDIADQLTNAPKQPQQQRNNSNNNNNGNVTFHLELLDYRTAAGQLRVGGKADVHSPSQLLSAFQLTNVVVASCNNPTFSRCCVDFKNLTNNNSSSSSSLVVQKL
ncbi:hypothetical protein T10_7992 [Trichinella papuae]|uniref:Uncharacterized protein n=1 Tax=Trichinella papuae TaxID=268474 RepID=A0A0V1MG97_9BILA|nr:hypothetical protein T10_7992 [Trichinella papuae]